MSLPLQQRSRRKTRRLHPLTLCAALLAFGCAGCPGCKGEHEQALRQEAGRLSHAITALREAPNDGKQPLLRALENTPCSAADLCALKTQCTEAYTGLALALDGARAARVALASPLDAASADAQRIAELVAVSEQRLKAARELSERCASAQGEVSRRYAL